MGYVSICLGYICHLCSIFYDWRCMGNNGVSDMAFQ